MTSSDLWDDETARRYDESSAEMFAPEVLGPTVDLLADLAGDGRALELAVGTGRVAVPLAGRGVPVAGIELSGRWSAGCAARSTRPPFRSSSATWRRLVCPASSPSSTLRVQHHGQPAHPGRAGRLLPQRGAAPGHGRALRDRAGRAGAAAVPPGQVAVPFDLTERHLGFDTYDVATQQGTSHHYWADADGSMRHGVHHFRYVWPAECDLMAELAGLELERRVAGWDGAEFTSESASHVSVWRKV